MRPAGCVVAVVQARMGSTRFPGKVLQAIGDHPMLWHVIERTRQARHVQKVVVATSDRPGDDAIARSCERSGVACFRGSEDDVLDRFYHAARLHGADIIVRITADCPFIDPSVIDKVIEAFLEGDADYVSNTLRPSYPDGLDTEVFSFSALESAWKQATFHAEREHVTPFMRTSGLFLVKNVENDSDLGLRDIRLTVDEPVDLEFARALDARLEGNGTSSRLTDIMKVLEEEPELLRINGGLTRGEGYYRSLLSEPILPAQDLVLDRSLQLKSRAERVIPSVTQTFSKGPTQFVQGVCPVFLSHGRGSHVWDVDGNEYIDYINALGPVILGYDYPPVTEAAMEQLKSGVSFSLPTALEVELAELLVSLIPCAEMVRFGKNGSDATSGAVRVARAWTGREVIACCGYHGWQDWSVGATTRNAGVPRSVAALTVPFRYNDLASLEQVFAAYPRQVAAVIMEPLGVTLPESGFLETVLEICRREGALLIFDEVVTGFRIALGGAQSHFGVTPDLACFGKAMANGFPLSAVVGRTDVMELFDEVFFSLTFGGEAVSLAAALATIREMQEHDVVGHLWQLGATLKDGYNVLARELGLGGITWCEGLPPHTVMRFEETELASGSVLRSLFQQEVVSRGILFLVGINTSYSHSESDVERTLRVFRAGLEKVAQAIDSGDPTKWLKGEPVRPVFRQP
jgi:glutamate-1-semialdehyde aminotransferase/spore coat polysaccharide biosynthesis protein SpsF (cytidylyltransferase family)